MNKTALIINAGKEFEGSKGELSKLLVNKTDEVLKTLGFETEITHIDEGYNIEEEADKMVKADFWYYQVPVWWMSYPWILKKYIDETFSAARGRLWNNDGRSRHSDAKYGTGGIDKGKKHMLSTTWNGPAVIFNPQDQFFEGKDLDDIFMHFHKAHEFIGLKPLPSFSVHDVVKAPNAQQYLIDLEKHLKEQLG